MDEQRWSGWIEVLTEYKGRIFGTLLGIIIGVLVLIFGWLKALYFLFCVAVGFYLGKRVDAKESLLQLVKQVFPKHED